MSSPKLKVKGILLDMDGTILDTKDAYIETAKISFQTLGQTPPKNAVALEIPKRIEQKQSLSDLVEGEPQKFLDVYLKTFYAIVLDKTKPIPHATDALEELSRKAKLALITMRSVPKETLMKELCRFKMDQYFSHIVTALDTHKPKPSPEALIKALCAIDVQIGDCVIVGDSVIDVQAGKAAGIKTVSVLSGLYSREELSKANPNYIIKDILELSKIVN
jgi:HAD superfamily hydrolase (TIGR01549 family)